MTGKENCLYKVGDILMLKENLILVKVIKTNKNKYCVIYPHLTKPNGFWVKEYELEEKPFNYGQIIFEAYIEYRTKYKELIDRLYSPNYRERY